MLPFVQAAELKAAELSTRTHKARRLDTELRRLDTELCLQARAHSEIVRAAAPALAEAIRTGRCLVAGCHAPGAQLPLQAGTRSHSASPRQFAVAAPGDASSALTAQLRAEPSAVAAAPEQAAATSSDSRGKEPRPRARLAQPLAQRSTSRSSGAGIGADAAGISDVHEKAAPALRCHVVVLDCVARASDELGVEDSRAVTLRFHDMVRARTAQVGGFLAELLAESARVYFGFPHAMEGGEEHACSLALALVADAGSLGGAEARCPCVPQRAANFGQTESACQCFCAWQ